MQKKLPEPLRNFVRKWESCPDSRPMMPFSPPITKFNEVWIALGGDAGIGTLQGRLP